jgi:LPS-assembly protein
LCAAFAPCLAQAGDWFTGFRAAVRPVVRRLGPPRLPEPGTQASQVFKLVNADTSRIAGDEVEAAGNVRLEFKGYEVWADAAKGNRRTQVFELDGNVRLEGKSETVTGEHVRVDFANDTFEYRSGRARLAPERLDKQLGGDVYVRSRSGTGGGRAFDAEECKLTTCGLEHPHWSFDARHARVVPGKRLVLRDVRLGALGRTLLGVPYLVVPLVEDGFKHLPEVGNNPQEGYYLKTRLSTPLPGESYFDTRLDLMTRLGVGLGVDVDYVGQEVEGVARVYSLIGPQKSLTASGQHGQRLLGGSLDLSANFQRDDYLTAPASTLWNVVGSWSVQRGRANTRLSYSRSDGDTAGYRSVNQSGSLSDSRSLGTLTLSSDVSVSRYDTTSTGAPGVRSERLDTRFALRRDWSPVSAELLYQRSLPIGRGLNFSSQADQTPVFTLRSSAARLWGDRAGRDWPLELEASVGEHIDGSLLRPVTRLHAGASLRSSRQLGPQLRLDYAGRFVQGVYSDDTAQYVLGYEGRAEWRWRQESFFAVRYGSLRAFGFAPLQADRTGRNDSFDFEAGYEAGQLRLSALTGYDLLLAERGEVPWQQAWLRADWRPGSRFALQASAVYDTFSQVWSVVRADMQFDLAGARWVAGASYDGPSGKLGSVNLLVEGLRYGKARANLVVDYNGFTRQVVAQHYQLVYDLHCVEAVAEVIENNTGFNSGRSFALYVRIKALPTFSPFGTGTRGQGVGLGRGGGF